MLSKNQLIDSYVIAFPIKEASYADTYRVKDCDGKNYFLKLIDYAKLRKSQFDEVGRVLELEIVKKLNHANLTHFHDSGEAEIGGKKYIYIVHDFIAGETVAQYQSRIQRCSVFDAKQIAIGVLNGLKYIHSLDTPVLHNEITAHNVMLDMSCGSAVPKLIDFGNAHTASQNGCPLPSECLNPFYLAPEAIEGKFSVQSDIYSVGALLYHLLFGIVPYFVELSDFEDGEEEAKAILKEKARPLKLPSANQDDIDEQLLNILSKALAFNAEDRFKSADEFMQALYGNIAVDKISKPNNVAIEGAGDKKQKKVTIRRGDGFKDVAGMESLKEQLQSDIIDLIQDPEQARALGLHIPNGILFFGPPGCGKTFFAEKFAEEAGFNYKYVKCSDVASPYIHGGQGKIAAIFDDARKNAPTILFFDEIDAMITDRAKHNNVSTSGEVNEFLAQLNNCGADGVLVIGATNKPDDIDEAALRSGRLEFKYYIPLPDTETRATMFEINLSKRRCDFGIDYDKLALLTQNYVSADITMIVDNAARLTFRRKLGKITQFTLEEVIANSKPSISLETIRRHEAIRDKFLGTKSISDRNNKRLNVRGFSNS